MIRLTYFPEEVAEIYSLLESEPKMIRPFSKAESRYQSSILSLINSLYKGRISLSDAIAQLRRVIRSGLKIAWLEGAEEAGAKTAKQKLANDLQLQQIIDNDLGYTIRLMLDIENAKEQNEEQSRLAQVGVTVPARIAAQLPVSWCCVGESIQDDRDCGIGHSRNVVGANGSSS